MIFPYSETCLPDQWQVRVEWTIQEVFWISHINSPPHTWFPLEQVLCLNGCDLWHSGEDVGAVSSRPLQTVSVVDLPIACFLVHVELNEAQTGETVQWSKLLVEYVIHCIANIKIICVIIYSFLIYLQKNQSQPVKWPLSIICVCFIIFLCNNKYTGTHTYLWKLVIEVHISSTQVSSQQCGVSGEDGRDGQLSVSTQHQAQAGQPLVELGHDVWRLLTLGRVLRYERKQGQTGTNTFQAFGLFFMFFFQINDY